MKWIKWIFFLFLRILAHLIFFQIYVIQNFLTNLSKTSLAKGTARSYNGFLPKLPIILPNVLLRNPSDWMVLGNCFLLSFRSVNILLAKIFQIFLFYLIVRNNSWCNSSSLKFFLVILNVVPALFLRADFNFFSCVFVSLGLDYSQILIFYKNFTLPWENFSLVSLIFSKIVKRNKDWAPSGFWPSVFFTCPSFLSA